MDRLLLPAVWKKELMLLPEKTAGRMIIAWYNWTSNINKFCQRSFQTADAKLLFDLAYDPVVGNPEIITKKTVEKR